MCNVQSSIYFMCICISILFTTSRAGTTYTISTEKNENPSLLLKGTTLKVDTQKEETIKISKTELRNELKKILASMSVKERNRQSKIVQAKLMNHPIFTSAKRVAVYINMEEEVSTHEIIKHIFKLKKECFIPKYDKHDVLAMVKVKSMRDINSLPKTNLGIIQPADDDDKREDALTGGLDLIIVPGLGFTNYGKRLGRGKGCYDRFLEKFDRVFMNNTCLSVGLAFNEQIVDDIPYTIHDQFVNYVMYPDNYVIPEGDPGENNITQDMTFSKL